MLMRRVILSLRIQWPKIRSLSNPEVHFLSTANSPPDHRHHPLVAILEPHGFSRSDLQDLLSHHHFPRTTKPSDIEECLKILSLLGLPRQSLVSLVSSSPRVLELRFLKKWQVGFSLLGSSTAPMLIQRVLEHSSRLMVDPEEARLNLEALREVGFCDETLIEVLEEAPWTVKNIQCVEEKVGILMSFGFQMSQIDRICRLFPSFLQFAVEKRLKPLLIEFQQLGFIEEARNAIAENPSLVLGMDVGELSRHMELLDNLKCRMPVKERILAKGRLGAAVAIKSRIDCLCRYGLTRRDSLIVVMREPRVILYQLEKIEEKMDFLCCKMGFHVDWLVEVPKFLGVNLEKQIVPRYRVIELLRSKDALDLHFDLRFLVKFSRKRFYNMFVKPYPECEDIFGGVVRKMEIKARHPVGLWKLFKPSIRAVSEEDVRNIKSFMEPYC